MLLDINNIEKQIILNKKEIKVDTASINPDINFLKLSRQEKDLKEILIKLTNNGYYLVDFSNGVSTFIKYHSASDIMDYMPKESKIKFNLIYSLEKPKINCSNIYLLVIFSSFQIKPYLATSPNERYFLKDFPTISKYIPQNVAILRIADIGGVAGSFYLNTKYDMSIENNIFNLIEHIRKSIQVKRQKVLLFGFSKGGTASLYYGIKHKYKCLAIDPIVSDEYHIEHYNDSHFTIGVFPYTKDEIFSSLLTKSKIHSNIFVISSEKSQQFFFIMELLKKHNIIHKIHIISSAHPAIQEHPDVGPNTINIFIMYINGIFYDVIKKKSIQVEC